MLERVWEVFGGAHGGDFRMCSRINKLSYHIMLNVLIGLKSCVLAKPLIHSKFNGIRSKCIDIHPHFLPTSIESHSKFQ